MLSDFTQVFGLDVARAIGVRKSLVFNKHSYMWYRLEMAATYIWIFSKYILVRTQKLYLTTSENKISHHKFDSVTHPKKFHAVNAISRATTGMFKTVRSDQNYNWIVTNKWLRSDQCRKKKIDTIFRNMFFFFFVFTNNFSKKDGTRSVEWIFYTNIWKIEHETLQLTAYFKIWHPSTLKQRLGLGILPVNIELMRYIESNYRK